MEFGQGDVDTDSSAAAMRDIYGSVADQQQLQQAPKEVSGFPSPPSADWMRGFNMDLAAETDPNFEPQTRARSNTWPLRPKEFIKQEPETATTPVSSTDDGSGLVGIGCLDPLVGIKQEKCEGDPLGLNSKKTGSRRNAWGNLSYADLITKAIQTSPEQRLTLSQIYDWMVQNVPYFKDKGDSNSSAGWKNSIRHNLSLHNRFMRIQNEGTGKSSWWVINPDAKPGKTPRRRATSMDTKVYEKKRGRIKKKVEQMRAAMEGQVPSSNPGSEFGDSTGDLNMVDTFNLSPQDFRARASSNASSIGRLSPIQSELEPDLRGDTQVTPISPISWNSTTGGLATSYTNQDGFTETLSESLAEMFVGDTLSPNSSSMRGEQMMGCGGLSVHSPMQSQLSPSSGYVQDQNGGYMAAPPPYPDMQSGPPQTTASVMGNGSPQDMMGNGSVYHNGMTASQQMMTKGMPGGLTSPNGALAVSLNSGVRGSPGQGNYMAARTLSELLQQDNGAGSARGGYVAQDQYLGPQQDQMMASMNQYNSTFQSAVEQQNSVDMNNSLLRQALTQKQAAQMHMSSILSPNSPGQLSPARGDSNQQRSPVQTANMRSSMQLMTGGSMQTNPMLQQLGGAACMPNDLDLNFADMNASEIECDVDQIIKHELNLEGSLDCNFEDTGDGSMGRMDGGRMDGGMGGSGGGNGGNSGQCTTLQTLIL